MSKIEIPDETKHNTPVTLQSHMNSEEKGSGSLTASISSPRDEQSEDECISYPSPGRLSLILLGLAFSIFLTGLDENIVSTAIPTITSHFHSINDVGWYGSAYLLTTSAFQLAWGKVYSMCSAKWTYIAAVALFEAGSLISGLAPSSACLIIGRAVSGLGGAGIISGALIIIAHTIPLAKRSFYTSLIFVTYAVAAACGPVMGGIFTSKLSWRWCFLINIPFGAVTIFMIAIACPAMHSSENAKKSIKQKLKEFDWIGTVLFVSSIVSVLLALQWGGSQYAWGSARIIALFVVFGITMILFIVSQKLLGERATVPGRILMKRSIACGAIYAFCVNAGMEQLQYFLPIWFQTVKGASPITSGVMSLPLVLSFVISGLAAGTLVSILGQYVPFILLGSVIMAIGSGMLTTLVPGSGRAKWIGYEIMAGVGVGLGLDQPQIAAQAVCSLDDVPIATSIVASAQIFGSALFLSVGNTILDRRLIGALLDKAPSVDAQTIMDAGDTGFRSIVGKDVLPQVVDAYSVAVSSTWYLSAALAAVSFVVALGMEWKSVKEETEPEIGNEDDTAISVPAEA